MRQNAPIFIPKALTSLSKIVVERTRLFMFMKHESLQLNESMQGAGVHKSYKILHEYSHTPSNK